MIVKEVQATPYLFYKFDTVYQQGRNGVEKQLKTYVRLVKEEQPPKFLLLHLLVLHLALGGRGLQVVHPLDSGQHVPQMELNESQIVT